MGGPYPARPGTRTQDGRVDTDVVEVVVTGPDADWVAGYTRTLVEERLAACGHRLAAVRSVYRWAGAVHDDPEARVALHTRAALVPAVVARTRELHPYDVPCVLALPVAGGDPDYLRWVVSETREP
jgi:periplasmic divalent cation tolerance protein